VELQWGHWLGFTAWMVMVVIGDRQTKVRLPNRDPYLLPVGAMLSGWGLMTIWRLFPDFGARQTLWFAIAMALLILGLRLPIQLGFLRRYKYVWLASGLTITALTLILGTNPASASGPRLWLGCCGVYFQPSEPLKLLLIIFISAYLADIQPWTRVGNPDSKDEQVEGKKNGRRLASVSILSPIILMTGLALLLLLVQRDLGTATIFVFLFTAIVYLATKRRTIVVLNILLLVIAGILGYYLFDVVNLRIDAWLNPWLDPSGRSYQIVQSLLALANGGVGGRGPGIGSPTLVPVSHSDFVFSAVVEESGLIGAIGLIVLLMLLTASGIRTAMRVSGNFRRYVAAGLTAYLVGQSILIMGGNIRLLPLTGVTLPFVSYGGSSLVTAFISLLLLLLISQSANTKPTQAARPGIYISLGIFLMAGLTAIALVVGWWTYVRGPVLLQRTDNARRAIADRYVERGAILDRDNLPLVRTEGSSGNYERVYDFPELGSLTGYSHPVYGQSGLEASLDAYLRGLEGNPVFSIWWNHILFGQPPPGLDIRLSLDYDLQRKADELIDDQVGGLVLLNASNGEVLALASRPTYDANNLDETWTQLVSEAETPLLNRVIQGRYQPGSAIGLFILADLAAQGRLPPISDYYDGEQDAEKLDCATTPSGTSWENYAAAGCVLPMTILSRELDSGEGVDLLDKLGFLAAPDLDQAGEEEGSSLFISNLEEVVSGKAEWRVSPLQMAAASSVFSAGGTRPAPQITTAVNLPDEGWRIISPPSESQQVFSQANAAGISKALAEEQLPIWESISVSANGEDEVVTWYMAGTLPSWSGAPLTLVILLEEDDALEAIEIGRAMMEAALKIE
jgi:cell division protein FtsW (lipid II flippase)